MDRFLLLHGFDFAYGKSLKTKFIETALAVSNPCDNKKNKMVTGVAWATLLPTRFNQFSGSLKTPRSPCAL